MGRLERGCEAHGRGWAGEVGEEIAGKDESLPIRHHGALLSLLKHAHTERKTKRLKSETKLFFGMGGGGR